jgi:sulfur-carrier protein
MVIMAQRGILPQSVVRAGKVADSIIVDLCGRFADAVGPSLIFPLAAPTPVADIIAHLAAQHPPLGDALGATHAHIAIDEQLAAPAAIIAPGQRLALFPPVSGG